MGRSRVYDLVVLMSLKFLYTPINFKILLRRRGFRRPGLFRNRMGPVRMGAEDSSNRRKYGDTGVKRLEKIFYTLRLCYISGDGMMKGVT